MAHQIKLNIVAEANTQGLDKLKSKLQEIKRDAANVDFTGDLSQSEIQKSVRAAETLQRALQQAYDPKIGTINIQKFNTLLKKSDMNVKTLYTDLSKMGTAGRQAFLSMTGELNMLGHTTKKTSALVAEMQTTMKNTIKWGISSGLWNKMLSTTSQAFNYVKGLDKDLNDIRIVTGKSANEMERFAKTANRAAKDLAVSTRDYTQGALIYYQQGDDDATAQAKAAITAKAANVTGQDMSAVSEQLTAVWNGYQVANEAAREGMGVYEEYVDKMAAVGATTATDLEELSSAMSKVASAASSMGVGFDQLNAQIATIVSVTRQAPESVGTALKTIYARMGDLKVDGVDEFGTKLGEVSTQLKTMGVDVLDSSGQMREMDEVMTEVAQKWDGWTSSQKQAAAVAMAGKRQYNNLIALFDNWDMYGKSLTTSMNAAGTLTEQQGIAVETLEKKFQRLTTTTEKFYAALVNENSLGGLVDGLTTVVDLVASITQGIGGLGTILPVVGGMLVKSFGKDIGEKAFNKTFEDKMFKNEKAAMLSQFGEDANWITKKEDAVVKKEFNRYKENREKIAPYERYMSEGQKERRNELERRQMALSDKRVKNYDKISTLKDKENFYEIFNKEDKDEAKTIKENILKNKTKESEGLTSIIDDVNDADSLTALLNNKYRDSVSDKQKDLSTQKKAIQDSVDFNAAKRESRKGIGNLIRFLDESGNEIDNQDIKKQDNERYNKVMEGAQEKIAELINAGKTTEEIKDELEKFLEEENVILRGDSDKFGEKFDKIKEDIKNFQDYKKQIEGLDKELSNLGGDTDLDTLKKNLEETLIKSFGNDETAKKAAKDFMDSIDKEIEKGLDFEDAFNKIAEETLSDNQNIMSILTNDESTEAEQELIDAERDAMEESLKMQATMENLTNVVGHATAAWGALNGVINAFKAASDPTLESSERLKVAFSGLITSVPILISSISGLITSYKALDIAEIKKLVTSKLEVALNSLQASGIIKVAVATDIQTAANAGLAASFKLLWKSMGPIGWAILAISAALAVLSAVTIAYSNAVQKEYEESAKKAEKLDEEQQQKLETAKAEKESVDQLVSSYEELKSKYENNEITLDSLRNQTSKLLLQYDKQDLAIKALSSDYETLNRLMKEQESLAAKSQYDETQKAMETAKNKNIANIQKNLSVEQKNYKVNSKTLDVYGTKDAIEDTFFDHGKQALQEFSEGHFLKGVGHGVQQGLYSTFGILPASIISGVVNSNELTALGGELGHLGIDMNADEVNMEQFYDVMNNNYDELYTVLSKAVEKGTKAAEPLLKIMEEERENVQEYQKMKKESQDLMKSIISNEIFSTESVESIEDYQRVYNEMLKKGIENKVADNQLEIEKWASKEIFQNIEDKDKDIVLDIQLIEKFSKKSISSMSADEISSIEKEIAKFNTSQKNYLYMHLDFIGDQSFEDFVNENQFLIDAFEGSQNQTVIETIFDTEKLEKINQEDIDNLFESQRFREFVNMSQLDFEKMQLSSQLSLIFEYYQMEEQYAIDNKESIVEIEESKLKDLEKLKNTYSNKYKDLFKKKNFNDFLEDEKFMSDDFFSSENIKNVLSKNNISIDDAKEILQKGAIEGYFNLTEGEQNAYSKLTEAIRKDNADLSYVENLPAMLGVAYDYTEKYGEGLALLSQNVKEAAGAERDYADELEKTKTIMSEIASDTNDLATEYKNLKGVVHEYNTTGKITYSNFVKLLETDSDLISCLKIENGQIKVNEEAYRQYAESLILSAIAQLENERQSKKMQLAAKLAEEAADSEAEAVIYMAEAYDLATRSKKDWLKLHPLGLFRTTPTSGEQAQQTEESNSGIVSYTNPPDNSQKSNSSNLDAFKFKNPSSNEQQNNTSNTAGSANTSGTSKITGPYSNEYFAGINGADAAIMPLGSTLWWGIPNSKKDENPENPYKDIMDTEEYKAGEAEIDAEYNAKKQIYEDLLAAIRKPGGLDEFFGVESSSDRAKSQERKKYDDEFDRYWKIDRTIEKTENELDKLSDMESHLFGKELQNNLKQTNKLLENNISQLREKYEIQKQEAAELRGQLQKSGVAFDGAGNITNYAQATQSALNQYNAVRDAYVAGTASEEDLDAAEKKFSDFKENLDRYSDLFYNDMVDTLNDIDDKAREIIENNLKGWEAVIEVELEKEEFERDWNEFQHEIEKDFKKQYENIGKSMVLIKKNTGSYKDTMITELNALADIQAEVKKLQSGGTSSMFLSLSEALDAEREQQEKVNSAIKDFNAQAEEAWNTYLEGIDQAYSKLDDFLAKYEEINEQLEYQGQLVELLYGEDAYSLIGDLNAAQMEVGQSEIASLQAALVATQNQLAQTIESNDDYVKFKEEEREIQSQINEKVLALVELYKNDLLNSVKKVTDELVKSFTGGMSLDYLDEQWERMRDNSESFFNDTEKAYQLLTLSNNIQKDIAGLDDIKDKQKLQALLDKELEQLREKKYLTEYDVKMAQSRLDILKAEIALEDARNSKNSMKLTRGADGNWSYQYVANEADIREKTQALYDAHNESQQIGQEGVVEASEKLAQISRTYMEKAAEIAQTYEKDSEEYKRRMEELHAWYDEQMHIWSMLQQERAKEYAQANFFAYTYYTGETNQSIIDMMTGYTDNLDAAWEYAVKQLPELESIAGQMGDAFATTNKERIKDALEEIGGYVGLFQDRVDELSESVGQNFGQNGIAGAISEATSGVADLEKAVKSLCSNEIVKGLNTLRDAFNEINTQIKNTLKNLEYLKDFDIDTSGSKPSNSKPATNNSNPSNNTSNSSANKTQPIVQNPTPTQGIGSPQGNGKLEVGDYVTYTGGWYYYDSYGSAPKGQRGPNKKVKIVKIVSDPNRPYPIAVESNDSAYGWLKASQLTGYDTGGYTGAWGSSGKLAILHEKELILNKQDTANILEAVKATRADFIDRMMFSRLQNSMQLMSAQLEMAAKYNSFKNAIGKECDCPNQIFNVTAEFPAANSVAEIREAILSLPGLASQKVGMRSYSRV